MSISDDFHPDGRTADAEDLHVDEADDGTGDGPTRMTDAGEALRGAMRALALYSTAMQQAVRPRTDGLDSVRQLSEAMSATAKTITRQLQPLRALLDGLRVHLPPNWTDDHSLLEAIQLAEHEGIPIAWVPPAGIVAELLEAADEQDRYRILGERRAQIADACAEVLAEVAVPGLDEVVTVGSSSIDSLRADLCAPAQALATNVIDTTLRWLIARRAPIVTTPPDRLKYKAFQKDLITTLDDNTIGWIRSGCVLAPIRRALEEFWPPTPTDPGTPVPSYYTRHATAHAAGLTQYTPGGAVVAVMLMVSLLRETQESGW
ncbi:hypothetical protein [Actinomadura rudentiformis]|uniref:Uncharacterized protein n=1 Tax=Actinomadura rudentiformis TaxID=359158 RepID=A0A6H9YVV9_9ACTN|nr:hypothetical protein [Actinomadura rudentiformis]KAB2344836.1 hypothetical protein F8566_30050 [Actinomadura rudentiformis]